MANSHEDDSIIGDRFARRMEETDRNIEEIMDEVEREDPDAVTDGGRAYMASPMGPETKGPLSDEGYVTDGGQYRAPGPMGGYDRSNETMEDVSHRKEDRTENGAPL